MTVPSFVHEIVDLVAGKRCERRWRIITGIVGWAAALSFGAWLVTTLFGFQILAGVLIGIALFLLPIANRLLDKGGLSKATVLDAACESSAQAALDQLHAAMAKVANGDVSAIKALYSHADEATSFYGWGGYEKGWEAVSKRWDWAARQFQGGKVAHETISRVITAEMFYVTELETFSNQRVAGVDGETGWSNRVTHVFAREGGQWRLIHRHANRLEAQFDPAEKLMGR